MYCLGKLTFALQHLVAMTVHFAGMTLHSNAVAAFHKQVSNEASVIATVDWGHCFPDVCVTVAEQLAVHTTIVSRAQAYAMILHLAGYKDVPDLLNEAQYKVNKMHSLGLVTDFAWSGTLLSSTKSAMRSLGSVASSVSVQLCTSHHSLVSV
jgi:hypothetical protein